MTDSFKARRRALAGGKVAPSLPKVPPGKSLKRPAPPLRGERGERGEKGATGPAGAPASIPPGSYVGQPVQWDGSAYVPLSPGLGLALLALQGVPGFGQLTIQGDGGLVLASQSSIALDGDSVYVETGAANYAMATFPDRAGGHVFRTVGDDGATFAENLRMGSAGLDPTIGFLGAAPVTRPSITGASTQDQLDSLVAALVALGLVTDDR